MSLFKAFVFLILSTQYVFAASVSEDRGPTGDLPISFVTLEPRYDDYMTFAFTGPTQRVETTKDFRAFNNDFRARGITPDGAGTALTEVSRFAVETFMKGRAFRLEGTLRDGDTQRLAALAEPYLRNLCGTAPPCAYSAVLSLDSPGGSFSEAVRLAEFIRKWGLVTVVDKNDRCESACALAFFSAVGTYEGYFGARRFAHVSARIGIHQPAIAIDPNDRRAAKATPAQLFDLATQVSSRVITLFLQTGVSIGALARMYETPPSKMMVLSPFQLIAEDVRLFDDRIEPFRGGRSDLIAMCAGRFMAEHYDVSLELVQNFQMREDVFITFDAGRNFLCTGHRRTGPDWRIMICPAYEGCPLIDSILRLSENWDNSWPQDRQDLLIWLLERGFLGFREFAHRQVLLREILIHAEKNERAATFYRVLEIPAKDLPMPDLLCGQLDAAHPELVLQVQRRLVQLGFDPGIPDGALGRNTRSALLSAKERLVSRTTRDDSINRPLLQALGIPSGTINRFTLCNPAYRD